MLLIPLRSAILFRLCIKVRLYHRYDNAYNGELFYGNINFCMTPQRILLVYMVRFYLFVQIPIACKYICSISINDFNVL